MRFLRILPAVWAMMTWLLAISLTRKLALGSSSSTMPSNSSCSSLAIDPRWRWLRGGDMSKTGPKIKALSHVNPGFRPRDVKHLAGEMPAGRAQGAREADRGGLKSACGEPLFELVGQVVAHHAIGRQPLLPAAIHQTGVHHMPEFHGRGQVAGQFQGPVLGLGRQGHD